MKNENKEVEYIIYMGSIHTVPEGMSETEFAKQLREDYNN